MKYGVVLLLLLMPTLYGDDKALYLDGQGDFVQLFAPIIHEAPFAIEAWAFMYGPGGGVYGQNPLFEQRSLGTVIHASALLLNAQNGDGFTACTIRDYEHYLSRAKAPQPPPLEWHHFAGVVTAEEISLYIDGQLVDSTINEQTGSFHLDYDHVTIGRHAYLDIVAGYLYGFIDDLRIWNHARSAQEIREGMMHPLNIEDKKIQAGLLACWNFDHYYEFCKNDIQWLGVEDLSGNGHHGVLMGNAELAYREKDLSAVG